VLTQEVLRDERVPTQFAFGRLLEWLDDGIDSRGERYLEMRRRLVAYFDRRNRANADELADEALNRIARTLEAEGTIQTRPPAKYCYVVARFVLLEDFRRERKHVHLHESGAIDTFAARQLRRDSGETASVRERRLDCLDRCLEQLRPDQRELIVEYYRDAKREKIDRRRALAARLGISMNALGIRVCRIRDTLTTCLAQCGERKDQSGRFRPAQARPSGPQGVVRRSSDARSSN
jgi:DNA-directed RNA polymerase specialized sigma24 family protein